MNPIAPDSPDSNRDRDGSAFWLILLVLFLVGCDARRLYEDNRDFDERIWAVADTVVFEFEIPPGIEHYNVLCNIRNSLDYPYSRIFVTYILEDSAHNELSRGLVPNYLFDGKTGKPFGRSGIGDIYDHQFPLLEGHEFMAGKYCVKLVQFMREDSLEGVLAAGIRVEGVEP